jgi:Patatin-like phospholipase
MKGIKMTVQFDPRVAVAGMHGVLGAGGSKAITLGTGAILAYHVLGLTRWKSIGCASGGFVPAVLLADQQPPIEFLPHVIEQNFEGLLDPRTGLLGRLFAVLRKQHYEATRPIQGVYGTKRFGEFVEKVVREWPDPLWVVASCRHGQVLMTKHGVYKYELTPEGLLADKGRLIATAAPRLGDAARATSAIPGLLDAVPFAGEYLVDGALSGDGDTPIGVVHRHFGESKKKVIAVDVGDENLKNAWYVRLMFNIGCGGVCSTSNESRVAEDNEALMVIRPKVEGFHSLDFNLNRDQKWKAVVAGFMYTVQAMVRLGLAPEDTKARALEYALDLHLIVVKYEKLGNLTCQVESYLAARGLYRAPGCA